MNQKRVAVIGAGYFGRFHHEAWARMPELACAASVDTDLTAAEMAAEEFGFAATFDDVDEMLVSVKPDIVDITTPPHTHFNLIRQIASSGAAIQCQKPFCSSLEEAKEAIQFIGAHALKVGIHENFRFQPWHRVIKGLLDQKTLGQVYQATFRLRPGDGQGPEAYMARQPYFQKMEKFLVRETAIHQIDLFRYFFGGPTAVSASLRRLNPVISGEDAGIILFDFADGLRAVFDGNRLVDHIADNTRRTMGELLVEGSEGSLRLDGDARIWLRSQGQRTEIEHLFDWNDNLFGGDCVFATCRAFLDHIIRDEPLENEAADYLINREIEEAVYQSDDERRWVELPG